MDALRHPITTADDSAQIPTEIEELDIIETDEEAEEERHREAMAEWRAECRMSLRYNNDRF